MEKKIEIHPFQKLKSISQSIRKITAQKYKLYYLSAIIMTIASILYVFYSTWSIWHPHIVYFTKNVAIAIATITFIEIGWNNSLLS